jgi:PST family polysaccharide transporter
MAGASWLMIGRLVGNMVGFVSTIVLARLLMPSDFGVVAIAVSVFSVVSALFELPIGTALIQLTDVTDDDFDTAWTLGLLKGLAVSLFLVGSAWPVAQIFHDERLLGLMLLLALFPILYSLRNAYFENYAREMQFRKEVVVDFLSKIGSFVATVGGAILFKSFWVLPAGMLATALVSTTLSYVYYPKAPRFSLKSFRRIFGFSAWLGASSLVNQLNWQSDSLLVGRFLGPAMLGQTSVGGQFVNRIDEVTRTPLFRSLFAAFSTIQTDRERLARAFLSAQAMCAVGLVPIGLGLSAVATPTVLLVLGDKWSLAALVVMFCGLNVGFRSVVAPVQPLATAMGKTRTMFERDLIVLLIRVPLLLAGLLLYGVMGLMIALSLATLIHMLIDAALVRKFAGVSLVKQALNCRRPFIAAGVMYAAAYSVAELVPLDGAIWIRAATLAGACVVGAVVYVGVLLTIWKLDGSPEGPEMRALQIGSRFAPPLARVLAVRKNEA